MVAPPVALAPVDVISSIFWPLVAVVPLVANFMALPLVSEFVFRSPQMIDASQKEVVDFLIACDGSALLVSQKCQEDPSQRDAAKTESWARKAAVKGAAQLRGALKPHSNDRQSGATMLVAAGWSCPQACRRSVILS